MPKVSVIVTVLNEEKTIHELLEAIATQTHRADQAVIVDGGSTDNTCKIIRQFSQKHTELKIQLATKKGNRSVGRNEAIRLAQHELVAVTDAGCIPHADWLEELLKAAEQQKGTASRSNGNQFVVAGYYDAQPQTAFEEAVIPYVLVMPDKVNPNHFLPATRSMLLTKSVWEKLGGFNPCLSDNEDYAFAHKIIDAQIPIYFAQNAQVIWKPRQSIGQFFWMIFRFARGDVAAGILRPKVVAIFGRYILGLFLFFTLLGNVSLLILLAAILSPILLYSAWAIQKNRRYVPNGWYWLPILQVAADIAVMKGSLSGIPQLIQNTASPP
jgi:glycosyltransferase involved in cell wall biosynthesis